MAVRTAAPLPLFFSWRKSRICGKRGGQALEDGIGAIRGAIVDDHQLAFHVFGQGSFQDERETALDDGALVVDRDEDRQLHRHKQEV